MTDCPNLLAYGDAIVAGADFILVISIQCVGGTVPEGRPKTRRLSTEDLAIGKLDIEEGATLLPPDGLRSDAPEKPDSQVAALLKPMLLKLREVRAEHAKTVDPESVNQPLRAAITFVFVKVCLLYTSPSPRDRG